MYTYDIELYISTKRYLQYLIKKQVYCIINNRFICINISCGKHVKA